MNRPAPARTWNPIALLIWAALVVVQAIGAAVLLSTGHPVTAAGLVLLVLSQISFLWTRVPGLARR